IGIDQLGQRRQLGIRRFLEVELLARLRPDAAQVDRGLAIGLQRRVPAARRLGENAFPVEIPLEGDRVAEQNAVGRAELDEIAVRLALEQEEDQQILKQLRLRPQKFAATNCTNAPAMSDGLPCQYRQSSERMAFN